jgi:aerotaxis receptor
MMQFIEKFSVKARFTFVVLLFLSLLALGGSIGYRVLVAGDEQTTMLMDEHVEPLGLLSQIRLLQADNRTQLLLSLQHDPTSPFLAMHDHRIDAHLNAIGGNVEKITALLKQYHARKIEDPREESLVKAFEESRTRYVREGIQPTVEALRSGDYMKANTIILQNVNPLFKQTTEAGLALGDHILKSAEEEQARFHEGQKRLLFGFGGLVAFLVAFAVFVAWATIRSIVTPLERIVSQFAGIAEGNLTQQIIVSGNNEITDVQRALARVQEEMRSMVRQIINTANRLDDRGRALGGEVRVVVDNSQSQSDGVMQVSAAMEQVTVSVGEVAQHTDQTAAAARNATDVVEQGAKAVEVEIRNTERVVEAVAASTTRMEQLRAGIDRIGNVTKVIREVADQTNLLALNAAIEAARAGEQGRGFAVVADEVRKLAERTSVSTADISRLIDEIQSAATEAVRAMEDARGKVEAAQSSARESGEALQSMRGATDQVSGLTQQIALATTEQSTAALGVTQSMEKISSLISDTHARVERVAAISSDLIETANQLQSAVKTFRV